MRGLWHPATEDIQLTQVMHALSDPVRLELVSRMSRCGPINCGVVATGIELHKSTLSHHYQVLREAGLTLTTLVGRERIVRLRRDDLEARFPGLLQSVLAALDRDRPLKTTT